jgi:ribosomal protein S18 acetylase RimI-like enzyme
MVDGPHLSGLRPIAPGDAPALARLLKSLPEGDRMFFKERPDADAVDRWCRDTHASRWLLFDPADPEGEPRAYLAIVPGIGWSSHVGELRLVVGGPHRRHGLGRALARYGLLAGLELGLAKLTVEVVAEKEGDIEMFRSIGFAPEALLRNQIRDRDGALRDLVVLAHDIEEVADALAVVGVADELGLERGA